MILFLSYLPPGKELADLWITQKELIMGCFDAIFGFLTQKTYLGEISELEHL